MHSCSCKWRRLGWQQPGFWDCCFEHRCRKHLPTLPSQASLPELKEPSAGTVSVGNISAYELPIPRTVRLRRREKRWQEGGGRRMLDGWWVHRALSRRVVVVGCGGVSQIVVAEEELRKVSYQKRAQRSPDRKRGSGGRCASSNGLSQPGAPSPLLGAGLSWANQVRPCCVQRPWDVSYQLCLYWLPVNFRTLWFGRKVTYMSCILSCRSRGLL